MVDKKRKARMGLLLLTSSRFEKPLLENIGLRPGFSPLYGDDSPTVVPEGDVGAGLAVYILKLISDGHVNFIELAKFGVTQHYAITNGDYTKELEAFAKLYGFEYINL